MGSKVSHEAREDAYTVNTSNLKGKTVADAKKYIKNYPNGNQINIYVCDSAGFTKEICMYNTIRLLIDLPKAVDQSEDEQIVLDAFRG